MKDFVLSSLRSRRWLAFLAFVTMFGFATGSVRGQSDAEQQQYRVQHSTSPGGIPAVCQVNFGHNAGACAQALEAQADRERESGNCAAAMMDYDRAMDAANYAGMGLSQATGQTPKRSECSAKMHPQASAAMPHGKPGVFAVGHYGCHMAPKVIAPGGRPGTTTVFQGSGNTGFMWIFDDRHYAAPFDAVHDRGTYHAVGNQLVADSGPYARSSGANNKITYYPQANYDKPAFRVESYGANGQVVIAFACELDGPI